MIDTTDIQSPRLPAPGTHARRAAVEPIAVGAGIVGGSASGLWIMHRLIRAGHSALLIEADHFPVVARLVPR